MKKFLLMMLAFCLVPVMGMAETKTYTDNLVVTINGESTAPQPTSILFTDNGDGTCNFALNNFCLVDGDNKMGVGNISLENLILTEKKGFSTFTYNGIINISEGDDPNIPADEWLGPMLGDVPLVLKGEVNDDKLYVSIDIDMTSTLEQMIYVKFGTDNVGYKEYTDNLVVTINDESTDPQPTTVLFRDNGDGTCNFALNNFCLGAGEDAMGVGNIKVDTLTYAVGEDGIGVFRCDRVINISNGDDPNIPADMWIGPMLGDVPLILNGKITEDKVYVTIDINMESLEQIIHVTLGDDNFAPPTYTLTFLVEGDTIQTVDLMEGDAIGYPQVEEREGYTFAWDKELTVMPAEATTITGAYTANIYKVTYMDGETVIASYEVAYGESLPEAPVYNRENDQEYTYTFEGWQGDVFTTMPAHDVVYTAIIKSTPTAIDAILTSDGQLKVYDLQGRRVERPAKGIYVINGKKVMLK